MQVLFSHGYFIEDDPREQRIMRPYPLGLLYLAGWLEKHGVSNSVFDTTFSTKTVLFDHLTSEKPPVLALYTNLMTKLNVIEIMRFVRSQEALKNTLLVVGGPDVSYNIQNYLEAGADVVVIGEGEQSMLDLALAYEGHRNWLEQFGHIPGIAFLQPDQTVHQTGPREKIRDIDTLPFPKRDAIDLSLYLQAWKKVHGKSAVSISTQRGCPYTCRWCSTAVYGQSYRRRSPENVVDEIEQLQRDYDFDLVWFVDDVFTVSHKWVENFAAELKKRKVTVQFECITRADRLNEEVLRTLSEMGCFRIWVGAESGSQRIIDAMDRRVDVGQVREMIRAARRTGIQAGTFIMLGYPGETEADIREAGRHLKESGPDLFTITVAYPIKGTGLYEEVAATTTMDLPWQEHTDRDIDFPRTYSRKYYDYAVRWTVNAVNWHQERQKKGPISATGVKLMLKVAAARLGMMVSR
ncbi:MAG: B12-binding domain-containing radical SAM protein [Lewinellaceae bacterium]|nr:B12-binding domain-containing radical SAM protein [Lewinellaceae bacterium]